MPTASDTATDRYVAPGWFTRAVFNPTVAFLTRRGLSVAGSRVLTTTGRRSGEPRSTAVNLLTLDGERYLVAPRGQTAWVRNVRATPAVTLRVGRRVEAVTALEVADADKVPVLRAYLDRWGWEVGQFFEGVSKASTDGDLAAVAPGFPVFRLT
jgi:deazaflavin-dependent oxidoreductase (nitroreductase family)